MSKRKVQIRPDNDAQLKAAFKNWQRLFGRRRRRKRNKEK